jgi:CubicO group peptidase (beta-lactamase class C family)
MIRNPRFWIFSWLMAGSLALTASSVPAQLKTAGPDPRDQIRVFENGLFPLPQGPAAAGAPAPKPQTLAERMAAYKVPGVSIAVVNNFKVEWAKGYGILKAGGGRAVTAETLFEAASTTKALVAATVMHYVDKKRLDLDADVNTYLKSWKIPDNEFTKEKKVTLRLLLTHRAGLPSSNMGYDEKIGVPTLVQVIKGESPAQNKAAVPELVPGAKWQYSNVGYALIQLILEDALGQKLETIMAQAIFKPLDLKTSTVAYPLPEALRDREALPHDAKGAAGQPGMHLTAQAQGGLMTTPSELAGVLIELMQAYRGTSTRILSRESARAMFHAEVDLDPRVFGTPLSEGLGMFVKGQGAALTILHPGNNDPGSICWMIGFPERGQGAVFMLNGANGELMAFEILAALSGIYQWPALM